MYRCRNWEKARAEVKHYKRREPEKTTLYRIVSSCRDELPLVWEERFQSEYGALRNEVLQALDEYLNCGILAHGAARVYCDSCKYSFLVAFSCKKRGICPSCSAKRAVIFAEHLFHNVIKDTPSRHIVFSIPKRLRCFFRYDRALNNILFNAAWCSVKENLSYDSGTPALVLTLQTAGEALNHNPHLHGALANGLFLPDGSFKTFPIIDLKALQNTFENSVLTTLKDKELIDDGTVQQILAQEHSGFSVWVGESFDDSESKQFVARYIERGPISLQKLSIQDDIVTYTTNDGTAHEFDALEFLALLTSHLPSSYESTTRYFGAWSCRTRGELAKKKKLPNLDQPAPIPEPIKLPSIKWADCMKKILEINPLQCPRCNSEMRIIAFLDDPNEISKIMNSLNIPIQINPEPLPRAPPTYHDASYLNAFDGINLNFEDLN